MKPTLSERASSSSSSSSSSITSFSDPPQQSQAVSSSSSTVEKSSLTVEKSSTTTTASTSSSSFSSTLSVSATEEPVGSSREGGGQESVSIERRNDHSAICRWTVHNFPKVKARALWSRYFEVGGYDCRLLVYPKGDSQALPGYFSIYLQIMDPRGSSSSKWDCFASYRLSIINHLDESKSIQRDSWHRFSSKKKSHGWCDFTPSSTILDPKSGFLSNNDSVLITADILVLNESVSFSRDNNELQSSYSSSTLSSSSVVVGPTSDVLSGKFTWKVYNFSLFKEMIKTQKIMSPVFPAGECNLRISVYQSSVNGIEYLSMCLESKDTEKSIVADRSCWCLFRMSVLNQKAGFNHMHRDSYGRFAADNKSGDNTSLGWNDYMKMSDFIGLDTGFLVDDTAVFSTSFHVIKESSNFTKNGGLLAGRSGGGGRKSDGHLGKFTWRIENFTRLKDLLKKRKITGLCVKSRRFQIGNRDCRLIVYPRGQSQPPCHLSVFLEVTDSRNTASDWSCFVSHRLSVVNQRMEDKSVMKESQNRYSKAAKDWGWREFVTLTSLFDQDSGFLVQDTVIFSAEVLILKETSIMQEFSDQDTDVSSAGGQTEGVVKKGSFTWKVENFLSFKEIMETRKIFSKFFQAGGCELRIGVYESFDTICIYLESDQSAGTDPDKNFWVRYRMGVVNQKNPAKTVWKQSSICTKTWNNSVLQFMKVSDMLEADAGFLVRDTVVFVCEIMDCCPWFEFSDLEVLASEDDRDALSSDPDEIIDSEDSEGISGDEEDIFRDLLSRAGFRLTYGDNPSQPQVTLREKLLMDAGAIAGFLTGLRVYLDHPAKVKRLLLPTKLSGSNDGKKEGTRTSESSPSLMHMLMGVKVLQQAIVDLLLDIMVECCQPSEGRSGDDFSDTSSKPSPDSNGAVSPSESGSDIGGAEHAQTPLYERLDSGVDEDTNAYAVQSSDMNEIGMSEKAIPGQPISSPESSGDSLCIDNNFIQTTKTKWPEQSEELLGLIVNSLRALDGAVPQGCPEPRRKPHSARKIALVLDKAPKHLQPDLVGLVPKLVDHSEHSIAARSLLDRLHAAPALRIPVLSAISQLKLSSEVWESVLMKSLQLLWDLNHEALAAGISFIFKAASKCQHLPEAVRTVRARLRSLGAEVSPCVLDILSKTVKTWMDVAEAILRDIHCNCELDETSLPSACRRSSFGESGCNERFCGADEQVVCAVRHFSDTCMLIDMLTVPGLAIEASQAFERAVAQGAIVNHTVAMVLERRHALRLCTNSRSTADNSQQLAEEQISELLPVQDGDFAPVLGLAETLALSRDPQVQGFVRTLYALLFRMYTDDIYRGRMLKGLVDRATNTTDNCHEVDLDLDILVFLVREEEGIARPVLSLLREVAELANVDRAALWHQLCATEDENIRGREERQAELSNMIREKEILSQRLIESEATTNRLKSEMRTEMDRFSREKKELSEQIQDAESQLEWLRSERDDEIAKIISEKKVLHDRLHDAETQLQQLKSRKREELKRVVKEKNALAERLKSAEAARKRFDEESKRYATETMTREEVRQSLEDEVRRLTQAVGQTEEEKREKEEQVARCEAYIDGMEAKLHTCQQYIHTLEASLQEEMSRHAPLYGAGLESLSMKELETLTRIHEEGLRQIRALQQRKGSAGGSPLVCHHNLPHSHGLYPTAPPPMPIGLPPSLIPNGVGSHGNVQNNGAVGPWFNNPS
ncbi:MATH [Macleaya cordata]|uniref:MATH n=1 Tax=Macleaya cordata TaxID=56857 RepID=A0A200PNQ8_MACCD|nr:MATH [Macleaya cordata]